MTILHMDTEAVYDMGARLRSAVSEIYDHSQNTSGSWSNLHASWEGSGRDDYAKQIDAAIRRIQQLAEEGDRLGQRVQREVEEWEAVDGQGSRRISESAGFDGGFSGGGGGGGGSGAWGPEPWYKTIWDDDTIRFLKENGLGGLGVLDKFNDAFKFLSPGLGGLVKALGSDPVSVGIDAILNTGSNISNGESPLHGGAVGLVQAGLEWGVHHAAELGIGATVVGVVGLIVGAPVELPVAAVGALVYVGYKAELFSMHQGAKTLDNIGLHDEAHLVDVVANTVDFDKYLEPLTHKLSEDIVDFGAHYLEHPDQIGPDIPHWPQEAAQYGAGLLDSTVGQFESNIGDISHTINDISHNIVSIISGQ